MDPSKSYKEYRQHLYRAVGACVPYLGVFLSDLTFIEDGNSDFVKGTDLINFEKCAMIAKVIRDIQQFQQLSYNFRPVFEIQNYLMKLDSLNEKEAYELSLQCEPRES